MAGSDSISNENLAAMFEEASLLLDLTGDNPHRVRSYATVARTLAGLPRPATEMLDDGSLLEVKGIGEGTAERIREVAKTGSLAMLDDLRAKVPEGLFQVLKVPGLGPKRAREVWQTLGVASLADLEYACVENRLKDLPGFGAKTQENVVRGIAFLKRTQGLRLLSQARSIAERVLNRLQKEESALRLAVVGSVRRMRPTVKDLNLLATAHDAGRLLAAFAGSTLVAKVVSRGETEARVVLEDGTPADLHVVPEGEFVAAQVLRTATPAHADALRGAAAGKGLRLDERGLFRGDERVVVEDDAEFYAALGLPFFPPELRETGDLSRPPPEDLVSARDVVGILHAHSTWSDGSYSVSEMARKAASSGFSWFAICDHSRTASYANGLTPERLAAQAAEVDALNASGEAGIPILKGSEVDILPDGSLDFEDDVLARLDVVVASVHSSFRQSEATMTERLVRAVASPYVHVLGHPTGRLLLGREGYTFDLDAVLDACAAHGTAIELNANPHRLDLDESLLERATSRGIRVAIDPDAHDLVGVDDVVYGVGAGRRGRLRKGSVLTALPLEEFRRWCAKKSGKPTPTPFALPPRSPGPATEEPQ